MTTKPKNKTIAAAEKRVIRQELKGLRIAEKKIARDTANELRRIDREVSKLHKAAARVRKTWDREDTQIHRRIAILEGRI